MKALIGQVPNLIWYAISNMSDAEIEAYNRKHLREVEMKDDSLSDVAFCNTKEGMHIKAKELKISAYNLGCSCEECNEQFEQMINSVGINAEFAGVKLKDFNIIWNAAIEASAKLIDDQMENISDTYAIQIKKLKK